MLATAVLAEVLVPVAAIAAEVVVVVVVTFTRGGFWAPQGWLVRQSD